MPLASVEAEPHRKSAKKRKLKVASANQKKQTRQKTPEEQSHTFESASESDGELFPADELVDCELEFYDPQPQDLAGLRTLLQPLFDGDNVDVSELAEAIIKQSKVGTIVKTAVDEDPLGVISVLSLHTHRGLQILHQLRMSLQQGCLEAEQESLLEQAWERSDTGLVLSERMYNCPPQLAPPLQQALFDEIAWATEDEPDQATRHSFQFKQYIMVVRVFTLPTVNTQTTLAAPGKRKKKKEQAPAELVYMRPEDEFYHKHSSWAFSFPVAGRPAGSEDMDQLRICMLLTAKQVTAAREELDAVVGNLAADA